MKAELHALLAAIPDPLGRAATAREYLQARLLASLQQVGAFVPLAFHGGTALRFLYGIARFSEDLDFALEGDPAALEFERCLERIASDLRSQGYDPEIKPRPERTVQAAFIQFPGLLNELGLSPHANEKLSIKIEVDSRPPAGAGLQISVVRRHGLLRLQHHDRGSLLAGKLHAVLQRPYAKGRDLYDLLWYLSDPAWPAPNLTLLANALAQSSWDGPAPGPNNWRGLVLDRLNALDWPAAVRDVQPFVEKKAELELLTLETFTRLLAE